MWLSCLAALKNLKTELSCLIMAIGRPRGLSWMRARLVNRRLRVRPTPGRQHSFVEIWLWNIFYSHLSLLLIQERAVVSFWWKKCTIVLVNRLEDEAWLVKVWLGNLTALDMTPVGWLGRKTSTQTKQTIMAIGLCTCNNSWSINDEWC